MNIRTNLIRTLAVLLICAPFALAGHAASPPQFDGEQSVRSDMSGGEHEPLGHHQTRECILLGMLGGNLPPHCVDTSEFEVWRQDFSLGTDGWADKTDAGEWGWCGEIEAAGIEDLIGAGDEVRPLSGEAYAVVRHDECNDFWSGTFPDGSAPASTLRPLNDHWPGGGYVSALHVYLDPNWPVGSGFGYAESFQALDVEFPNFRYVFMPVERNEDGLFVGAFEVTEAGWYTFSTFFTANEPSGRELSADFVLSRHGWPLYQQAQEATFLTEEPIDSFEVSNVSNGYIWFVYISDGLDLAIDEEQMRTINQPQ